MLYISNSQWVRQREGKRERESTKVESCALNVYIIMYLN